MLPSNLKHLRLNANLSQREFAELFSITRSNVDSYERGNAKPKPKILQAIAAHFKLSIDTLYTSDLKKSESWSYFSKPPFTKEQYETLIKSKDELIEDQRQMIQFLKKQIESLVEKIPSSKC